jgi:putative transposase
MRRSRFTDEEVLQILREAGTEHTVGRTCQIHGISEATYYRWKNHYTKPEGAEERRFKELERENLRLKKCLAERMVELDAMKDLLAKKW